MNQFELLPFFQFGLPLELEAARLALSLVHEETELNSPLRLFVRPLPLTWHQGKQQFFYLQREQNNPCFGLK